MSSKKNEATFVGFKLLIADGQLQVEMTDISNKDIEGLFEYGDWVYINSAINAARRGIKETINDIEKELGAF